jgi:hypothetical protein
MTVPPTASPAVREVAQGGHLAWTRAALASRSASRSESLWMTGDGSRDGRTTLVRNSLAVALAQDEHPDLSVKLAGLAQSLGRL